MGTRVFSETALLGVSGDPSEVKNVVFAFDQLSPSKQKSILELHGSASARFIREVERQMQQNWEDISDLHRRVLAIWATNTFGSLFWLGSRINHSCLPNIHFAWSPVLKKETFHAVRDIMAAEELTISHIDGTNRTKSQREALLENWDFKCSCPACEDTLQRREREKKRAELFALDQQLALISRSDTKQSFIKGVRLAQKLAAIQVAEGLVNRELRLS